MATGGNDETVLIRFGANIDAAKNQIGQLGAFVRGFADGVASELRAAGSPIAALGQRFKDLGDSFADAGKSALGKFGPVVESAFDVFGKSATVWGLGMVAAAAGVKAAADANAEMVESTRDLARALGITTNEASVMRAVFADVGASQGEYEGASKGLSRQLKTNEEGMNRLGLVTRDAAGNLRPLNDLTLDAIKVLGDYREGTDRAMVSRELFGRGISASSRLMLINNEVVETNRAAVEELGLTVGESAVKAWQDYDNASDRAGLTMQAFGKAIQESVLPVATELTEWFNNLAPAAIDILRGAIGGLSTAFLGLTNGVRVVWEVINAMVITVAEPIRALGSAIGKALTGDFAGAAAEVKGIGTNIGTAWETALTKIEKSSEKTRERIGSIWAFTDGPQAKGDSGSPKGSKTAPDTAAEKEAEKARLKAEEDAKKAAERDARERARMAKDAAKELAREQAQMALASLAFSKATNEAEQAEQAEHLRQAMSIYDEAYKNNLISTKEFYDAKLAIETKALDLSIDAKKREADSLKQQQGAPGLKGSQVLQLQAQEQKALGEINVLEAKRIDLVRQNAAEYLQAEQQRADALENIRINGERATGQAALSAAAENIAQRRAMLQISAEEEIALRADVERRGYEIERTALQARMDMVRGDAVKTAELMQQMEQLQDEHQNRLTQIANDAVRERNKYALQANDRIKGDFVTLLNDLMDGTKKLSTAFRDFATGVVRAVQDMIARKLGDKIFDSLGGNKVVEMLVKPFNDAIEWIISLWTQKEAAQTAATVMGVTERNLAEASGEEESLLISAAGAVKRIAMAAWEAAASVYASIAAIPYVGPFLAPAAAIAAGAVVLGFAKNISSAEGGWWQVPQDQVAAIHKNEMVLPAAEAQGIRQLISDARGPGSRSAGEAGGTFIVNAMDAKSVKRLLMENSGAVAEAVRAYARNGGIPPKS